MRQHGMVNIRRKSKVFRNCKQANSLINSIAREIEALEANGRRWCNRPLILTSVHASKHGGNSAFESKGYIQLKLARYSPP
jgi:hypothetical protein